MGTATMQETGLPDRPVGMQSTIDLLERFKKGDEEAVNLLVERSIPPLKRWARGRLPQWARRVHQDAPVQSTLLGHGWRSSHGPANGRAGVHPLPDV